MTNEIKQEASLPVQARIDIRTLANLVEYWKMNGEQIRTMSQLVSWSIELVQHMLSVNNMLPSVIDSVTEANMYLIESGLYQPGSRKRGYAKVFNAMNFESLRNKGINPSTYVKYQYNTMHKKESTRSPGFSDPVAVSPGVIPDDTWERAQKKIREEETKERVEREPDNTEIVPQIMSAGLDEATYNRLMAEPTTESKSVKKKDTPRVKTEEEIETMETDFEKEERKELERLRNM